jgi:hypothetical protein
VNSYLFRRDMDDFSLEKVGTLSGKRSVLGAERGW